MRLADPITTLIISRSALLALVSGALVEQGANAQPGGGIARWPVNPFVVGITPVV